MATHVIEIPCASPADAENALEQIREIGFPIEGENLVDNDATIWIDDRQTGGVISVMERIVNLGLKPHYRSVRNG